MTDTDFAKLRRSAQRAVTLFGWICDVIAWHDADDVGSVMLVEAARSQWNEGARKLWQCSDLRMLRRDVPAHVSRSLAYSLERVREYVRTSVQLLLDTELDLHSTEASLDMLRAQDALARRLQISEPWIVAYVPRDEQRTIAESS